MDELRSASVRQRIFLMALIVGFGVLALVLAAVGVYGVLSLVVAERTREIGIRLALGASPRGLVALIVKQALLLDRGRRGGGHRGRVALSPLVASQLFGVGAADPLTIAGVAGVLLDGGAVRGGDSRRAACCASIPSRRSGVIEGTVMKIRASLVRCACSACSDRRRSERELSAEIESHLQLHIDDNIRAGMTPAEARRRAVIALGGVEGTKEAYRDRRGLPGVRIAGARRALRRPHADQEPGLRDRRHRHSRPRHRRQHRDLHGRQRRRAEAAAVRGCRSHHAPLAHAAAVDRSTTPMFALSPANFIDWEAQNQVVRDRWRSIAAGAGR